MDFHVEVIENKFSFQEEKEQIIDSEVKVEITQSTTNVQKLREEDIKEPAVSYDVSNAEKVDQHK